MFALGSPGRMYIILRWTWNALFFKRMLVPGLQIQRMRPIALNAMLRGFKNVLH